MKLNALIALVSLLCLASVSFAQKNTETRAGTIAYVRGSTEVRLINAVSLKVVNIPGRSWLYIPTSLTKYFSTCVGFPMAPVFYSQIRR